MNPLSAFIDSSVTLGPSIAAGKLTLVPLLAETGPNPPYLTLAEGLSTGKLKLGEVGEGVVPEIQVANQLDLAVLIFEGEEVIGAKQNRVMNTTILIAAHSTITIPVTCTEQGRWHHVAPEFGHAGYTAPPSVRANNTASVGDALRLHGTRHSDQVAAWNAVAATSLRAGVNSPTGALRDVFADRQAELDALVSDLAVAPSQVGAIALVNGAPIGLDCTGSPALFHRLAPRLYRGYALEAVLSGMGESGAGSGAQRAAAAFLADIAACDSADYPGVGFGRESRLTGPNAVGVVLMDGDTLAHGGVQCHCTPPPFDRSYWVEAGWLLAGYYPGAADKHEATRKLDALLKAGIRCVINLTEEDEHGHGGQQLRSYANLLKQRAAALGTPLTYVRIPIADLSTPSPETMRTILDALDSARARRQPVYVHCWGGRGRTGTVVGCFLARHSRASGDAALALVQHLRRDEATAAQPSPENEAQRAMVRGWREGT